MWGPSQRCLVESERTKSAPFSFKRLNEEPSRRDQWLRVSLYLIAAQCTSSNDGGKVNPIETSWYGSNARCNGPLSLSEEAAITKSHQDAKPQPTPQPLDPNWLISCGARPKLHLSVLADEHHFNDADEESGGSRSTHVDDDNNHEARKMCTDRGTKLALPLFLRRLSFSRNAAQLSS